MLLMIIKISVNCKTSQDNLLFDNLGTDLIIKNISGCTLLSLYPAANPHMQLSLQSIYKS